MRTLYEVRIYRTPDLQGEALIHLLDAQGAAAALHQALKAEGYESLPDGWSATAINPETHWGGIWTSNHHVIVERLV